MNADGHDVGELRVNGAANWLDYLKFFQARLDAWGHSYHETRFGCRDVAKRRLPTVETRTLMQRPLALHRAASRGNRKRPFTLPGFRVDHLDLSLS
jgi:hypothetical protein